jgi:hypothetical protein
MTINVTGAYLTVVSPSGIPMVRAQNGVVDFNGILPETGDYTVRVEVSVGTGWVDYSLGVTII